jgi:uncharacterized membrane protein YdjX (TVP38/TMEM64 family)
MDMRKRRNLASAVAAMFIMLAMAFWLLFSPAVDLDRTRTWINALGFWGMAVFFLFYALAVVLLVPGSILALIAGLAYGLWGLPLALAGATTGATVSFFAARYLARAHVQSLTKHHMLWRAVEHSISDGGWRIVGLMRLSPLIPFNLLNYFFGITRIRFRQYLPATLMGIVPGTTVNVSFAAAGQAITVKGLWHPLNFGLFVLGMIVTLAAGWVIHRRVHAMFKHHRSFRENTKSYSYRICKNLSYRNFQELPCKLSSLNSIRDRPHSIRKTLFL